MEVEFKSRVQYKNLTVTAEPDPKRGFILTHRCRRCGAIRRNKAAEDDDRNAIIRLTAMH